MRNVILTLSIMLFALLIFAQSPQSFQYQSVVRDGNGDVVVNQPVSFQVSLISGSSTGTVEYSETHAVATNAFGLVTLAIGEGTLVSGSFAGIDWSSSTHFIKVEVDINGGTAYVDMGTSQLLSVPYALNAKTSEDAFSGNYNDLNGLPVNVSTFTNDAGYVTTSNDADADPANELQILTFSNDTLYLSNGGFVSLSGYSDTLWRLSGTNIYNTNSGKVGVGTNTPPAKLVVQGDASMADTVPLFEVKDRDGHTVFIVYPDSARFYVGDDGSKTSKGAFAVSGRNTAKQPTHDFLWVTPDSTRIFTGNETSGFGVENIESGGNQRYMRLTPENYFIGHQSGINTIPGGNDTGRYNVFVGYNSGIQNTIGYSNVFIGYLSGNANTSGYLNVANGSLALESNTEGSFNVAIGSSALLGNLTGNNNTALGALALYNNTTAHNNTALGTGALLNNTTASNNTATGQLALWSNTTGNGNNANGSYSLYSNSSGIENTASGASSLRFNTVGNSNSAFGYQSLNYNVTGHYNVALGTMSGFGSPSTSFSYCTFIGAYSYPTVARNNVTFLGYGIANAQCTGNNQVLLGNTAITQIRAQVSSITAYSDARFKTNVKENVPGLDFVMKLKPVTYNEDPTILHKIWGTPDSLLSIIDHSEIQKQRFIGFLAQDVEIAAKECGFAFPGIDVPSNDKEVYSLRYVDFIMPIVKSVQEQQEIIAQQQKIIEQQQKEIEFLKDRMNNIETTAKK